MENKRKGLSLYSFHSRVVTLLMVGTLVATALALVLSYTASRSSVRVEFGEQEAELAQAMLELSSSTSLGAEEIIRMTAREDLSVSLAWEDIHLRGEEQAQLDSRGYVTVGGSLASLPVTWVRMGEHTCCIQPSPRYNLFVTSLVRIASACLSFAAMFLLMVTLVSSRISRPVSTLTAATRQVAQGDFAVRVQSSDPGEVGELMNAFNSMTEALGRNAWLQKDFIANVSHEFRTPIAAIKGYAMLLQMPGLSEAQRAECVQTIAEESDRLSRLSDTLLRLSALEQRAVKAKISRVRLDEQIRRCILRLEPIWSPREIDWELELDEMWIESDADLLVQVWVNLIQNAIKFSPQGGTVSVRLRASDGKAVAQVADQGEGMDEETLRHVFERFYQGDKSRRSEGTGIGLCLVQRILTLLGGTVEAASVQGEGSVFTVTLPLQAAAEEGRS